MLPLQWLLWKSLPCWCWWKCCLRRTKWCKHWWCPLTIVQYTQCNNNWRSSSRIWLWDPVFNHKKDVADGTAFLPVGRVWPGVDCWCFPLGRRSLIPVHPTDWQLSTHSILSPIPATLSCQDMCTSEDLLIPSKSARRIFFLGHNIQWAGLSIRQLWVGWLWLQNIPKSQKYPWPQSESAGLVGPRDIFAAGTWSRKVPLCEQSSCSSSSSGRTLALHSAAAGPGRSGSQLGIRTTRLFSAFPHHCSRSDFEQTDILRGFDDERASRLTSALVVSCSSLSSLKGFWRLTHWLSRGN